MQNETTLNRCGALSHSGRSLVRGCGICQNSFMAEEKKEETSPAAEAAPAPSGGNKLGLLLTLINTVALVGVLGLAVYTKLLYKRPPVTESASRAEIEKSEAAQKTPLTGVKSLLKFEPIQANLKPSQIGPTVVGGPPPQMKPHFLTMTMAMELTDSSHEQRVKEVTPKFMDQILQVLGNTSVDELATVQGRFILRSRMSGIMNELVKKQKNDAPIVTNVYFSDFVVQ